MQVLSGTARTTLTTGSTFEAQAGYSRLVQSGEWIFLSGTTGFDYSAMTISDRLDEQVLAAFDNVRRALAEVGGTLDDVLVCNWVITDPADFECCGRIIREQFGGNRPAMMTLVCGLIDPRMKFEMQVTARLAAGR
jgi:enamine deaminase RidA (YjgF/YER057c/UK114 family)